MCSPQLLRPALALREVHLWCVFSEDVQSPALLRSYEKLLSQEERKLVDEAPSESARKERLLARALVRTTLARYANGLESPAALKFKRNRYGKPELVWPRNDSPILHFNLSHSDSLLACGIASSQLGVDVEDKRRPLRSNCMEIVKRRFSPKEVCWLENFADSDKQRNKFFQLWTLKEAYGKALGKGINRELLRNFGFRLDLEGSVTLQEEGEQMSIISLQHTDRKIEDWQFLLFEPSPQHLAAICIEKDADERQESRSFKFWRTVPLVEDAPLTDWLAIACSQNLIIPQPVEEYAS